jgi:hypothetical protein
MNDIQLIFSTTAGLEALNAGGGTSVLLSNQSRGFVVQPMIAALGQAAVFTVLAQHQEPIGGLGEYVQLWRTDGTEAGTSLVISMPDNSAASAYQNSPGLTGLVSIGNRALFVFGDGSSYSYIWSTDGTASGTVQLPIDSVYGISGVVTTSSGAILLSAGQLYETDGTISGTQALPFSPAPGYSWFELVPFDGGGAFVAQSVTGNDFQIFITDFTAAGTHMVADFPVTQGSSDGPGNLVGIGNKLVFSYGSSDTQITALWSSDGTLAGTQSLGVAGSFFGGVVVGDQYFVATSAGLVVTDGTAAGTSVVFPRLGAGLTQPFLGSVQPLGDGVIFDVTFGPQVSIYFSDGTASGTRLVSTLPGGSYNIGDFASLGNAVIFNYGNDVWITDGTTSGTRVLITSAYIDSTVAIGPPEPTTMTATLPIIPCFAKGTKILTANGEVVVEGLAIGDLVVTVGGEYQMIQWIGRRHVKCHSQSEPTRFFPVRIMPDAFGCGRPNKELMLSPDHSVFIEGVLVPVRFLVNGTTIEQVEVEAVTYFHIEVSRHDVVLVEGLPVETYLDTGGRGAFEGQSYLARHPSDRDEQEARVAMVWHNFAFAPLVGSQDQLERIQSMLAAQATMLGWPSATNVAGIAV